MSYNIELLNTLWRCCANIRNVSVRLEDGTSFTFQYDPEHEVILNGAEFLVSELQKLQWRMDGQSLLNRLHIVEMCQI